MQATAQYLHEVKELCQELDLKSKSIELSLAPAYPYLHLFKDIHNCSLTAQDVASTSEGAYTGDVSATMLKDFNTKYALVGHSERRSYHSEANNQLRNKVEQLKCNQITPIYCIGETLEEKEQGMTETALANQLRVVEQLKTNEFILAYEPRWAIGTGKMPIIAEIEKVANYIQSTRPRQEPKTRVLYGGSVSSASVKDLMQIQALSGFLVGSSALKLLEIKKICEQS